ncbi:hypothetical protein VchM-138_0053 [Vibrio phage vB_VchM-138]|nr:hypothetical protein F397_gp53 [Vibrio phage vB_VchM-138]AFC22732.1 hypothetical protein VchM-138_0053 [Vibrio phage vB_VchM-138]
MPPLTTYEKLTDGTLSLAEVLQMNMVLDTILQQRLDVQSN